MNIPSDLVEAVSQLEQCAATGQAPHPQAIRIAIHALYEKEHLVTSKSLFVGLGSHPPEHHKDEPSIATLDSTSPYRAQLLVKLEHGVRVFEWARRIFREDRPISSQLHQKVHERFQDLREILGSLPESIDQVLKIGYSPDQSSKAISGESEGRVFASMVSHSHPNACTFYHRSLLTTEKEKALCLLDSGDWEWVMIMPNHWQTKMFKPKKGDPIAVPPAFLRGVKPKKTPINHFVFFLKDL